MIGKIEICIAVTVL